MDKIERRVVTVLFADLVGFTALSEKLEPEDTALIQNHYFRRVKDAVLANGGRIEKFIGDAAVAVFGLPIARENDAERAVTAGLQIVREVEQIGAQLGMQSDFLSVRVGVNTGEVVFSQPSPDPEEWRITGDSINVAARLQSAARPGGVLLGPITALSVEAALELEAAGPLTIKGKTEPVLTWWATGVRTEPSRYHALGKLKAPTIGRDAELALLREAVKRVAGEVELWLIAAPPGVGKSRLLQAFSDEVARSYDANLWETRVREEAALGYEPIKDLLGRALNNAGIRLEDRAEAERLLGIRFARSGRTGLLAEVMIEHSLTLTADNATSGTDVDRETLFNSWATILDVLSDGRPAIWIVDDLHWANPDVIAFFEFAAEQPSLSGRLILTAARPALLEKVPDWSATESDKHILHLTNLQKPGTKLLIESLLGPDVLSQELIDGIVTRADGNPLFVEELIRSWIALELLYLDEGGRWAFKGNVETGQVPTTVQAIYSAQLDALPQNARQAVRFASIVGRRFPARALEAMGVPEPESALSILVKGQLLSGPHDDTLLGKSFDYRHALLRDVAYASLPRSDRTRLHLSFAEWLEHRPSCPESAPELIGNQYCSALENMSTFASTIGKGFTRSILSAQAASWLERAAERDLISAPQSSTQLFQRCLDLTPDEALSDRLRLSLNLGEAFRRSAHLESAMATFDSVAIKSIVADDSNTMALAAIGYEDALFASRRRRAMSGDKSENLLTACLETLSDGDNAIRSRVLAALGRARIYAGALDEGQAITEQAVAMARRVDDSSALAYALLSLRSAHAKPDDLSLRLQDATEMVLAARKAGDKEMELEGQRLRLLDLLEMGDVEQASSVYLQTAELIEELRRPMYFWYEPMWNSMFALFQGSFTEAEEKMEHFLREGERWNYHDVRLVYGVQYFQLHKDRGVPDAAQEVVVEIGATVAPNWSPILASLYSEMGLFEQARTHFEVYAPSFSDIPTDLRWPYLMALLSETCSFLQDRKSATNIHRLLSPWADHNVVLGSGAISLGSAAHFLGLAARTSGDLETAAEYFRKAKKMNKRMGALPAELRSRFELARTQTSMGRESYEEMQDILEASIRIGMEGIARQALEHLSGNTSRHIRNYDS